MPYVTLEGMNATKYSKLRDRIGSQQQVADLLGVDIRTVQRRECGFIPVTPEAARSIMALRARQLAQYWLENQKGTILPNQINQILVLLK